MENNQHFIEILDADFKKWAELNLVSPTNEEFLKYLINRNIVGSKTIKRLLVINEYPHALDRHMHIKRSAIWDLESMFDIPESTIIVYLKRFQTYFRYTKNK